MLGRKHQDNEEWPLYGYAPGGYMNECITCEGAFVGDKRAQNCPLCALQAQRRAFDDLRTAAVNLRSAQQAYLADRGNETLGAAVGAAAAKLDEALE